MAEVIGFRGKQRQARKLTFKKATTAEEQQARDRYVARVIERTRAGDWNKLLEYLEHRGEVTDDLEGRRRARVLRA
jgi:hypothetical protein